MTSWRKLMMILLFFHMGDTDSGNYSRVHLQRSNFKKYNKKHYKHEGSLQLIDGEKHNEGKIQSRINFINFICYHKTSSMKI